MLQHHRKFVVMTGGNSTTLSISVNLVLQAVARNIRFEPFEFEFTFMKTVKNVHTIFKNKNTNKFQNLELN